MLFCLASGAAFGAMAVFGKLAYAEGATVGTLLAVRFLFASGLFWAGGAGRSLPARRDVLLALGLGAGGYALQAGFYFAALERIDASLLSLLVFTFPVIVAVAAVALGRERLTRRRAVALAISSARARARRRRRRCARSARRRARARRGGPLQRLHPRQRRDLPADGADGAGGARVHRRGGGADRGHRGRSGSFTRAR